MPATMTDGGSPIRCAICGASSFVDVSRPPGDSVCPVCGSFLWVDALVEMTRERGFVPNVRLPELAAMTRTEAIYAIVAELTREFSWTDQQSVRLTAAVLARESLGTTGIGRGLALPHAYIDWVERPCTALAYLPYSIAFDAVDQRPVHTIALVACPKHDKAEALRTIAKIAESLRPVGQS